MGGGGEEWGREAPGWVSALTAFIVQFRLSPGPQEVMTPTPSPLSLHSHTTDGWSMLVSLGLYKAGPERLD